MARRRGAMTFWIFLVPCLYVLMSVAIAIMTVDKCGDESADKSWRFVPPSWECEGGVSDRPVTR